MGSYDTAYKNCVAGRGGGGINKAHKHGINSNRPANVNIKCHQNRLKARNKEAEIRSNIKYVFD